MWHLGTLEMSQFFATRNCPYVLHRYFKNVEEQFAMYLDIISGSFNTKANTFVAVGKDYDWIRYLVNNGVTQFCVDMAHGNSGYAEKSVAFIKGVCPNAVIMAGNIETWDGYSRLADAGATYFRVGIASGSICSTNINTGNGLPILTALDNIYDKMTLDQKDVHFLIADGGMRTAGDIAKAIAFGASYTMCGKIFASTSLAAGPFYTREREIINDLNYIPRLKDVGNIHNLVPYYVQYAGMASTLMREKANGSQSTAVSEEGKAGLIRFSGTTENVFDGLMLNLKAVLSYSGCKDINEFREEVILQRIAMGGKREKKIHLDHEYS